VKGDKRPFLSAFKSGCDKRTTKEWRETLATTLPTITPITTATDLHDAANKLQHAFDTTCEKHFKHKRVPKVYGHKWWNTGCTAAAEALKVASAGGEEEVIKQANTHLRKVTKTAKREWADNIISEGQVWEVARWRHGRKQSQITAICTLSSQLTFDNNEMAEVLAEQFFAKDPGPIQTSFPNNPPPRPTRKWNPLTLKELGQYLEDTSDTSAPGNSGVVWWTIKMGWKVAGEHICWVLNASLSLGVHPDNWKTAMVMVIPKPNWDNYFTTKNYCPILLLECLSKLLEKAVSKCLLYAIDKHALIPMTQFGT
jgi:hypothetical protein